MSGFEALQPVESKVWHVYEDGQNRCLCGRYPRPPEVDEPDDDIGEMEIL